MDTHPLKKYIREPVNGLTHLAGAIFSVLGLFFLLDRALDIGSIQHFVAFLIFGLSMTLLYTASSLYHSLQVEESTIELLRKLDHSMIYVLIAGTYTPICLIVLDEPWKWAVLAVIWVVAVAGIIKKLFWFHKTRMFSMVLYLGFGWAGIMFFPVLFDKMPIAFLVWIALGGLAYSVGTVFLGIEKPVLIPKWVEHHEIWHLFVMAGTFSHFYAIYIYLPSYGF
ncbi:MAG: hemolysin III family protein [Balneolaceae bacterium]|nr:hemolysin III family protein [Balneolaceae bacterium]